MKTLRSLFFMFLICCSYNCLGQVKEFTAKEIEKAFARVNDSLYACRYETSNFEYNSFLKDIAQKDLSLYLIYRVDSAAWLEYNEPLVEHYHKHAGFKDYPVLCISYEGAIAYCNWLTELYHRDTKREFHRVAFVLPTEDEWELAARGTNKNAVFPWGTRFLRDTRKGSWEGQFLCNYRHLGNVAIVGDSSGNPVLKMEIIQQEMQSSGVNDRAFYTAAVNSFYPNNLGIFNQSGNAAEMTIQKGLTKGGSWNSLGGEISIAYKLFFYKPSPEVGFRVFMKVIEK